MNGLDVESLQHNVRQRPQQNLHRLNNAESIREQKRVTGGAMAPPLFNKGIHKGTEISTNGLSTK